MASRSRTIEPVFTEAALRGTAMRGLSGDVVSRPTLYDAGCTRDALRAQLEAGRWKRVGKAIVLHNGPLERRQGFAAAVINCGPRAVLASFSAAEVHGLKGWERAHIHVLAPAGVAKPHVPGLPIVLHRTRDLAPSSIWELRRLQRIEHALVLAAGSMTSARSGCGILAAGVQQRLTTAAMLREALQHSTRVRHHHVLTRAVDDIEMGAHALSEIDFVELCRRNRLPPPSLQAVRIQRDGKRRYLDVEWRLADGRRVVVEVDGALHTLAQNWFNDQLRQNSVALGGALVLRYPSFIVRSEPALVIAELRQALGIRP